MPTTLYIPSFAKNNILERTNLSADYVQGESTLTVESTAGYGSGKIMYVGQLQREGCEKAIVDQVTDATHLSLVYPLSLPHARLEPVASVLGDLIHIYRAADLDGTPPLDDTFSVLATRPIDPDQISTYYTDSAGDSTWWYRYTYYNATTLDETALSDSPPVRGDDFGHYCSISEIRREAGFEGAVNLSDVTVDQQRRAAESEVNSTLKQIYTVPFTKPIPELINTITIKLAAGLLLQNVYAGQSPQGDAKVKDARAMLQRLRDRDDYLPDDPNSPGVGQGVTSWPGEGERHFTTEDVF